MTDSYANTYTIFDGHQSVATGELNTIAITAKQTIEGGATGPVLIFDDATGRVFDINTRGTNAEVLARLVGRVPQNSNRVHSPAGRSTSETTESIVQNGPDEPRGRGRPKLGVVPREVTLLPRHWEWLSTQPGGASVALRKLVEEARRTHSEKDRIRKAHERAYEFMSAMSGDFPGFEEAIRALFANDQPKFNKQIAAWPVDIRNYATRLAFGSSATMTASDQ